MDGYIGLFSTDEAVVQTELDLVIEALIAGRVVVVDPIDATKVIASSITTAELAYLDGQDQYIHSTASPTFVGLTLNGVINYTPDSGTILSLDGVPALVRHSVAGAMSFGADEILIIGAGEGRSTVVSNTGNFASETLWLAAESGVRIVTHPDNWVTGGWSARNEWQFNSNGSTVIPGTVSSGAISAYTLADGVTNHAAQFVSPAGRSVSIRPSLSIAAYNSIVQLNDQAILASGGSVDTGVLVLTTWSNTGVGVRITNNSLEFRGVATFNSAITANGDLTISKSAPILYLTNTSTSQYTSSFVRFLTSEVADPHYIQWALQKDAAGAATGGTSFRLRIAKNGGSDYMDYLYIETASHEVKFFGGSKTAGYSYGNVDIANGSLKMAGTVFVDGSRNVSAADFSAITTSATGFIVNRNSDNSAARVVMVLQRQGVAKYRLAVTANDEFMIMDPSTTNSWLTLNGSGATFPGTISSGAITSTGKFTSTYTGTTAPHIFRTGDNLVARFSNVDGGMLIGSNNASQALIYAGRKDDGTNANTVGTVINMMSSGEIRFGAQTGRTAGAAWTDPTLVLSLSAGVINSFGTLTSAGSIFPDSTANGRNIGAVSQGFRTLYIVHPSNQASGIVLNQTLADIASPRLFFYNATSWAGSGAAIYQSAANALLFTTGATPDSSSGTGRWFYNTTGIYPSTTDAFLLGGSSNRWSNVYSVLGNFSGLLTSTVGMNAPYYQLNGSKFAEYSGTEVIINPSATWQVLRLRTNNTNAIVIGSTQNVTISAGDLLIPDAKNFTTSTFTSGILGSGMRIDNAAGLLEINNIVVRNTLRTHIFQKDIVKAVNGYLYITDSGVVSGAASGQIKFKASKSASFTSGMTLWIKDANENTGTVTSIKVTLTNNGSTTGDETTYTCTYTEGAYTDIQDGMVAVRTSGGTILLDASSSRSPFIDISDGTSVRLRTGNLSGKVSSRFGALNGYGLWSENVYLEGDANIYGNVSVADGNVYMGLIKRNLTTYSENVTTYRWMANSWSGTQTFTFPSVADPFGNTSKVVRMTLDSGATLYGQVQAYGNSFVPVGNKDIVYSISFWARANSSKTLVLRTADAGWTNYATISASPYNSDTAVTTDWKRFTFNGFTWSQVATECRLLLHFTGLTAGDWVEVTGMQLEENSKASAYQRTDGTSAGSGYGMWSIAGGFGGTIQNPIVSLSSLGMSVAARGTTEANATEVPATGVFIGDYKKSASNNSLILRTLSTNATSGLFYYQGSNELFALRGDGTAQIAGWNFNATTISSGGINLVSSATAASNKIYIGTGTYNNANTAFYIDGSGQFSLKDKFTWNGTTLTVNGTIIATNGSNIAGWVTTSTTFSKTQSGKYTGMTTTNVSDFDAIRIYAGADDADGTSATFIVRADGSMLASSAAITGDIIANTGKLGGATDYWSISSGLLTSFGTGSIVMATAGSTIKIGTATDYSTTGSGVFLGGDGKFRVGTSTNYLRFSATGIEIASSQFTLTSAGVATFSGALSAASGSFAGSLSAVTGTLGALTVNGTLTLGTGTIASTNFNVTSAGVVTMTGATVSGTINASAGTFSNSVYVGATSNRIIIDGANKLLKSENYVSNTTGWAVKGDGTIDFRAGVIGGLTVNATSLAYSNFSIRTGDVPSPEAGKVIVDASGVIYISDTIWITKFSGSPAAGTIKISGLDDKIYVGSGIVIDGTGAGTITGGTIQTAATPASGTQKQIKLNGATNELIFGRWYSTTGTLVQTIIAPNTVNDVSTIGIFDAASDTNSVFVRIGSQSGTQNISIGVTGSGIASITSSKFNLNNELYSGKAGLLLDDVDLFRESSGTLKTTANFEIAEWLYQNDLIRPYITVGGNASARTFTIDCNKFNNTASANTRMLIHWWFTTNNSTLSPSFVGGTQSASVTTGENFGTVSTTSINRSFTNSSRRVVVTITNAHSATSANLYLVVEVQGILFVSAVGTIYTTGSAA
jgi:hypothetical protein